MATLKHTPGPWVIGERRNGKAAINAPDGNWWQLAKVYVQMSGESFAEGEANACLIAAAPDMLAALREFPGFTDDATVGDAWIERVRAIIAKAEGQ